MIDHPKDSSSRREAGNVILEARANTPDAILGATDASRLLGISRQRVYQLIDAGKFPAPLNTGYRPYRWLESALKEWAEQRTPNN